MKLKHSLILAITALGLVSTANAENMATKGSSFQFSTQVSRIVEKDLMTAEIYSRKSGKKLSDLKRTVSTNLNKVIELAKQSNDIEISANGISNYADYDQKGKVIGWVAEGRVRLSGKNFDAVANVLESLGEDVAISYVNFSVSREKSASLEDEMTIEIINQFQHKAEIIKRELKAEKYTLSDVQLNTPNGRTAPHYETRMYAESADNALPLEAGKQTVTATASGRVFFE